MNTVLLHPFGTPYASFPFSKVNDEDFEPAIKVLLANAREEIELIAANPDAATYSNTIEALEYNGKQLNRVVEVFFNINSAETNDYIQETAQKIAPELAAFSNDILLNESLFKRVEEVFKHKDQYNLNKEQEKLLEKTYKRFVRNGALLNEETKKELREIDRQLAGLTIQFSQNVLQETNNYKLHLTAEKDITGIPESILAQAGELAKKENKEGYIFTLHFPSYVPFMKYAGNRARREELYKAYNSRSFQRNEWNNEAVIKEIIFLKDRRARLLGYKHYADFVLEERMAGSEEKVERFLRDLLYKAKPFAGKEIEALKMLAAQDGIDTMMPYDHAYYAERLREQKFAYSEEMLKPYFPLQQVLNAAFGLAGRLFGLTFDKVNNVDTYHQEVTVYNVLDNGKHKALLYTDFHPREGKRSGAWMTSFGGQYIDHQGTDIRPHISIVCNFSRPTGDTPSLLTFDEVTTLFHEFGHALHGIMAGTQYESLSGTNVYWDFVELPSQFLENYCYEKEFLKTFARHWETGEVLDDATIDKIVAAANFMEGYQTLRQLSFGLLDMAYYSGKFGREDDVASFEQKETAETQLYPFLPGTAFSTSFSHIFGGGYAAGYYSYKWAEVLDADAFDYFKETGIFNRETAARYRTLLSKGGTEDPMDLYIAFRGREPRVDALLKRAGLQ